MLIRTLASTLPLLAAWLVAIGPVMAVDAPAAQEGGSAVASRGDTPSGADGPLPHVGDRGPVEGAPDGLSLSPAVLEVAAPPGRRVVIRHLLANTTDGPLEVRIDVPRGSLGPDGPVIGTDVAPPMPADAAARIVAPLELVSLAPGEGIELQSTAEVTADSSALFAVRATTRGGTSVTALVVLTSTELPADLELAARAQPRGTTDGSTEGGGSGSTDGMAGSVELVAARYAVVDVRLRLRSWIGVLADRTVTDLIVGPDEPRILEVERPVGAPPGRLHIDVTAVDRAGEERRAAVATTVGITPALVAVVLLVIAGSSVGAVRRQRHLRSDPAGPDETEEHST
jgi:hypothetical protein